jgi:hypothetical protein
LFVGHYSASFLAKSLQKTIPLWLLFIAVQLVDILWAIFVLLGIEKIRIVPGITASNALDLYYMPFTHSLVGAFFWSALAFRFCQFFPSLKSWRTGLLVAAAVFSHWVLDLIVHRPDLALYDNTLKMGFGLWNYREPAFILEIGILIAGTILYLRTAPQRGSNYCLCVSADFGPSGRNIPFSDAFIQPRCCSYRPLLLHHFRRDCVLG